MNIIRWNRSVSGPLFEGFIRGGVTNGSLQAQLLFTIQALPTLHCLQMRQMLAQVQPRLALAGRLT